MDIPVLQSVKNIELQFNTGEQPVLVTCSDKVSIDYGCILNTATFEYPMSQLTSTDTILWSDLFHFLAKGKKSYAFYAFKSVLESAFPAWVKRCEKQFPILLQTIPKDWYVEVETVENKLSQLFEEQWIKSVWDNFVECLNENISHE